MKIKRPFPYACVALTFFSSPLLAASCPSAECEENITVESRTPAEIQPAVGTASRLGLTDKEIPRYVETFSQKEIRVRGDRTLAETVSHATGMSGVASPTLSNSFSLRGFMPVSWLLDGMEMPGSTLQLGNPAHYGQVDILHGPGSTLNGLSATAGSVNLVSRQPSFVDTPAMLNYRFGSYSTQALQGGAGGTLLQDKIAWRLDASGSGGNSQVQHERNRQSRVSGSLLFRLTDDTTLTLYGDRMNNRSNNPYFGTPLIEGKALKSLRGLNYNNLTDATIASHATALQAVLDSTLAPGLSFNNHTWYYTGYRAWHNVERYRYSAAAPDLVNRDSWGDLSHKNTLLANRSSLSLDGPLLGFDNRLVAGIELQTSRFDYQKNGFPGSQDVPIFNPPREPFSAETGVTRTPWSRVTQRQSAAFLEDSLQLTRSLSLLSQLRFTKLDMDWRYYTPARSESQTYSFLNSGLGLNWDITDNTTLYVSYANGKEAGGDIFFLSADQTHLPLTQSQQWETGIKSQFWDNKVATRLALYQLRKNNLFTPSAITPGELTAVGQQTSRGIEFSTTIQPNERWEMAGNLAWTHARFDRFSAGNPPENLDGNQPAYVPTWTGNLALTWHPIAPLSLRSDLRYVGSSFNDNRNTRPMDDYITLDLAAEYRLTPKVTVGTRVRNLTDTFYTWQRTYDGQALIAPSRTWEGWVTVWF
ncbi:MULTISPECIES: TonB-dependent receptor [Enterobacteriaceae]|uniref:TonB-dependent siderophore receptor n=1 Tax=Enterobacteriaceae TaxID=543 RepID=UPI0002729FBB|nr:TonB-dependent receptor [Enterobacter sp. Ag1]EJF32934.1 TonB-dependent siderophore receptor [Enterobacter sp. Ag1]